MPAQQHWSGDPQQVTALVEFLRAQIATDQQLADEQDGNMPGAHQTGVMSAEFRPDRVRAECAFKRAVVNYATEPDDKGDQDVHLLRLLASVYAHRPGFRAEWLI